MANTILDKEYRDSVAEASYPFLPNSSLKASNGLVLDLGLFLDALFYPIDNSVAPYYLYSIRGPVGESTAVVVTINDSQFKTIGKCECYTTTDSALCYDNYNRIIGVIVYSPTAMEQLANMIAATEIFFSKEDASFAVGCSFKPSVNGSVRIEAGGNAFTKNVNIVAANGFTWQNEGSGVYSLNLYGELRSLQVAVKSINGIAAEHVWIAAYPGKQNPANAQEAGSDIRVSTVQAGTGLALKIGKARDFTYGE